MQLMLDVTSPDQRLLITADDDGAILLSLDVTRFTDRRGSEQGVKDAISFCEEIIKAYNDRK